MAQSQNGWTVISSSSSPYIDKSAFKSGVKPAPGVQRAAVKDVLHYVGNEFNDRVEKLVAGWCWGYAYRPVRGQSSGFSNHASGTAIDLNAPRHPLGKKNTFSSAQVKNIRKILAECEGLVTWGGDWTRPDEMHFQISTNVKNSQLKALAIKLKEKTVTKAQADKLLKDNASLKAQVLKLNKDLVFVSTGLKESQSTITKLQNTNTDILKQLKQTTEALETANVKLANFKANPVKVIVEKPHTFASVVEWVVNKLKGIKR